MLRLQVPGDLAQRGAARRAERAGAAAGGPQGPGCCPHGSTPWPSESGSHSPRAAPSAPGAGYSAASLPPPSSEEGQSQSCPSGLRPAASPPPPAAEAGLHPGLHSECGTGVGGGGGAAPGGGGELHGYRSDSERSTGTPTPTQLLSPFAEHERGLANGDTMSVWAPGRLRSGGSCPRVRRLGRLLPAPVDLVGRFVGARPLLLGAGPLDQSHCCQAT